MVQTNRITESHSLLVCSMLLTLLTGFCGCGDSEGEPVSQGNQTPATTRTGRGEPSEATSTRSTAGSSATSVRESDRTSDSAGTHPQPETVAASGSGTSDSSASTTTATGPARPAGNPKAQLEAQLAALEIPPTWLADVKSSWDVAAKPWKEGRVEIRRLLGAGDDASRREGIRLTWDYLQKKDIGDGHEYGMYLFLGREPLWAVHVYREWLSHSNHDFPPFFGFKALASLYCDYGLFEDAEKQLEQGMAIPSPKAAWKEVRQAEFHDAFGDLYARWGQLEKAKASYREAIRLFPLGKPPYGQHLLPRKARKVGGKLRLLTLNSLAGTQLKDGTFRESAVGYSGDIHLTVRTQGGRIVDIQVKHQEKIDQNASTIIPRRIIARQGLQVDGITGATVTKDALVTGTLRALKQAGLK